MKPTKILAAFAAAALFSSCENGVKLGSFSLTTPYGSVSADKEGTISGGISIPQKSGK